MNRCHPVFAHTAATLNLRRISACLALMGGLLGSAPVLAQSETVRPFPAQALRGTLVVTQPPLISIDGQNTQLSPGARIFDAQNRVVPSSYFVNQSLTVNYTREQLGLVHEVWILRPEEAALKRPRAGDRN